MRRIAVFVFYDSEGIVDSYVNDLLSGIRPYVDYLIAVSNGKINFGMKYIKPYADRVIVRQNKGYDAGAYKEIILGLIADGSISQYDQMILFNDTIYGFLYPLSELFGTVEAHEAVDLWGMTEHSGRGDHAGLPLSWHLQGYFIVITGNLLHSGHFHEFWEQLEYPENYTDAIFSYEIGMSQFFMDKGYVLSSIYDIEKIGMPKDNEFGNIYFSHIYELVTKLRYPVLKVKSIENLSGLETLKYIENHNIFDTGGIWAHYKRRIENKSVGNDTYDLYALEKFCNRYSPIYIYGNGDIGRRIYKHIISKGYRFAGFLVTKKEQLNASSNDVYEFHKVDFTEKCGIIIGMKRVYREEVIGQVLEKICEDQVFMPIS